MFQEIPHNGTDRDIFAHPGNPRLQTADPPDNQVNFHPCRRSLIQGGNDILVAQGIHFGNNPGRPSIQGKLLFPGDKMPEPVLQPQRRQRQFVPHTGLRITRKHVEYGGGVLAYVLRAGQKPNISVKLCRGVIVISRAQMYIPPDAVLFPAHYQRNLTVGFQAYQTVNHMAARFFQHSGPYNIIFLVKAGLQLHQHRHLLAVLCRLGQRRNDRGIAADPVEGLLDGQNLRILCRLPDKVHHRGKGLVRMVQQNISFEDFVKNMAAGRQLWHRLGRIPGRLQMPEALHAVNLHQHRQIQRPLNGINILGFYTQLLLQDLQKPLVAVGSHFQPDGLPPLTFLQLLFYLLQKVGRLVLLYGQVRIAHDSEGIRAHNVIIQKELVDIPFNNFFQKDNFPRVLSCGQLHHTAQHAGYLHHGKFQFLPDILFPHQGRNV